MCNQLFNSTWWVTTIAVPGIILWGFKWLQEWADRSLLKFNKGNCKVLPLGRNSPRPQEVQGAVWLESSLAEKDPGVLVATTLSTSQQRALATKKTSDTLGCITQSIASRPEETFLYPSKVSYVEIQRQTILQGSKLFYLMFYSE